MGGHGEAVSMWGAASTRTVHCFSRTVQAAAVCAEGVSASNERVLLMSRSYRQTFPLSNFLICETWHLCWMVEPKGKRRNR